MARQQNSAHGAEMNQKRVRRSGSLDSSRAPSRQATSSGRSTRRSGVGGRPSAGVAVKKKKKTSWGSIIVIVLCLAVLIFCGYKIISYFSQQAAENAAFEKLLADLDLSDETNTSWGLDSAWMNDSSSEPIVEVGVDEINIKDIPYLNVNLAKAKQINSEVLGWFYFSGPSSVYGLPINNALMKTTDNDHYLNYNVYNEPNENGAIYMDYRNYNDILKNRNTIIYGHARSNRAFAGLKYLNTTQRWYLDANNHFIKIQTGDVNTVWQVFSWYETTSTADYTRINFSSDQEFIDYANKLQSRNQIPQLQTFTFTADSKILTLSTCKGLNESKRVAVHAVLVKSTPA